VIELGEKAAGWKVLKIEGPVRLAETEALLQRARTLAADGDGLELDLGSAEHIHAAGLQILRALERHCQAQDRPFRLGTVSDKARDALALCGLGHWLEPARNTEHGS
jgi:ABC-type transporter Mla MlaB component